MQIVSLTTLVLPERKKFIVTEQPRNFYLNTESLIPLLIT